jgi:hypothetical protein
LWIPAPATAGVASNDPREAVKNVEMRAALDDLAAMIESARAMPMSASCIINRGEALDLVNQIRQLLPQDLHHAEFVLREREAVIEEGRREAKRILAAAHEERARLLARPGLPRPEYGVPDQRVPDLAGGGAYANGRHGDPSRRAEVLQEAEAIRLETDEYVDQQLANLEVILNKALASVQRGRDRLRGVDEDFGPPGHVR